MLSKTKAFRLLDGRITMKTTVSVRRNDRIIVQDTKCMNQVCNMDGLCMDYVRIMYGLCMDYVWIM